MPSGSLGDHPALPSPDQYHGNSSGRFGEECQASATLLNIHRHVWRIHGGYTKKLHVRGPLWPLEGAPRKNEKGRKFWQRNTTMTSGGKDKNDSSWSSPKVCFDLAGARTRGLGQVVVSNQRMTASCGSDSALFPPKLVPSWCQHVSVVAACAGLQKWLLNNVPKSNMYMQHDVLMYEPLCYSFSWSCGYSYIHFLTSIFHHVVILVEMCFVLETSTANSAHSSQVHRVRVFPSTQLEVQFTVEVLTKTYQAFTDIPRTNSSINCCIANIRHLRAMAQFQEVSILATPIIINGYLVGGPGPPLWKIWFRQLGWLFPIYGKIKNGNQTTNQISMVSTRPHSTFARSTHTSAGLGFNTRGLQVTTDHNGSQPPQSFARVIGRSMAYILRSSNLLWVDVFWPWESSKTRCDSSEPIIHLFNK